jgi:hypothetical protein
VFVTSVGLCLLLLHWRFEVVYEKQEEGQAKNAKAAAVLREKQDLSRQRKKDIEAMDAQRLGYRY